MIAARIKAANDTPHRSHMCQIRPNPQAVLSMASTNPAAVFFGIWIGWKPCSGRTKPWLFMSYQASAVCTTGVKAKLYIGGGDEVDHSSVRPFHGSPVVSRSRGGRPKLNA